MFIGIDCGYRTGGIGIASRIGDWAEVHDLPVYSEGGVDVTALRDIITSVGPVEHIYIERQAARPKQGVSSTFKLGYAFGQITTTVMLSGIPHTLVMPAVWKRTLGLGGSKDDARLLAQRQYPSIADQLKLKKHEHRAEGLLLAHYGRKISR